MEQQDGWYKAFDYYQLESFYTSEWLGDTSRTALAARLARQYGLKDDAGKPTNAQVAAVHSFP
jgi:hypothetical protein